MDEETKLPDPDPVRAFLEEERTRLLARIKGLEHLSRTGTRDRSDERSEAIDRLVSIETALALRSISTNLLLQGIGSVFGGLFANRPSTSSVDELLRSLRKADDEAEDEGT